MDSIHFFFAHLYLSKCRPNPSVNVQIVLVLSHVTSILTLIGLAGTSNVARWSNKTPGNKLNQNLTELESSSNYKDSLCNLTRLCNSSQLFCSCNLWGCLSHQSCQLGRNVVCHLNIDNGVLAACSGSNANGATCILYFFIIVLHVMSLLFFLLTVIPLISTLLHPVHYFLCYTVETNIGIWYWKVQQFLCIRHWI